MNGKEIALQALSGKPTQRIPAALFTWEFDYNWKVAGLEPWQLACGGSEQWHLAHMALLRQHQPDLIWYNGAGNGIKDPILLEDTEKSWFIKEGNSGLEYELIKESFTLREKQSGAKSCDSVGAIESKGDADKLIPDFDGWGHSYLGGLKRLIADVGKAALVLPHHSPAYICACYAFGFEKAMEAMFVNPDLFVYVCQRYAAGDELRMQELADAGAEVVFIADGWASCDIISPSMVEEFALPYQASITDAAHKAGLKIVLWNEGDILPILDKEAELSMEAFAFEQPRKGIDLSVARVRQAFGPERCLFGNFDSELLLMRNDAAEIKTEVESQIRQSGKNSPFVFCTGSPIPSNIEIDAVDKMINTVKEFKWVETSA